MTKKNWLLTLLAVALGGLSLYINRDWFAAEEIHINHRSLPRAPQAGRMRTPPKTAPVLFGLSKSLKLTEVKVLLLHEVLTNKYAHPVWHMVSDSNSVPVRSFQYGQYLRGMRPNIKGAQTDPLQPGVKYRLRLKTVDEKQAEHDFEAVPLRL